MRNLICMVILLFVAIILTLLSNPYAPDSSPIEKIIGFTEGVTHGAIILVTIVLTPFEDGVYVYNSDNIGFWYDFGFLIGISFWLFLLASPEWKTARR